MSRKEQRTSSSSGCCMAFVASAVYYLPLRQRKQFGQVSGRPRFPKRYSLGHLLRCAVDKMICSSDVFQQIVQSLLFKGHNTDQNLSGSEKSWNEKKKISVWLYLTEQIIHFAHNTNALGTGNKGHVTLSVYPFSVTLINKMYFIILSDPGYRLMLGYYLSPLITHSQGRPV